MAIDFDKGMRPNLFELMQNPSGELEPATAETLGGVKIGRGVNVEPDGTISVTAPAPVDTYTKEEIDAQQEAQDYNINSNTLAIERLETAVEDTYTQAEIDAQQSAQDANITANASAISALQTDVQNINTEQQTQDTAIAANAAAILAHAGQLAVITGQQTTQDTNIAENAAAIAQLASEIESLVLDTYTKAEIDTQQGTQDTAIGVNAQNIAALQNSVAAIQGQQTTQDNNIAANAAAIATNAAAIATNAAAIATETSAREAADTTLASNIADLATRIATDSMLGLIKTNSAQFIETDENGMLKIGGRLGQFSNEEMPDGGLYYPLSIQPEVVWKNSFLITEGTLISTRSSRIFALAAGANVNLKTAAAAGATRFEVSNTFANRFTCAMARNGYATIQESTAGTIMVHVTNVYLANDPDKTPLIPYSGATESRNNIVIETDAPLSDTDTVAKLRLYGTMTFDSSFHCGQGNGTGGVTGKGKLLQLGQSQLSLEGNSILIGNSIFNSKNRCAIVGASHINHVQGACLTGEGHDTTDGAFVGITEHGKYSLTKANTAFAIGNGTSNTARSNLFEIADDNGTTAIMVKSPSGTEFKISVDDNGQLITTQM